MYDRKAFPGREMRKPGDLGRPELGGDALLHASGGTARLSPTERDGMGPTSVMDLAIAERRDLADLLATLTPEQWAAPTLCTEWSVRDVAAHLVSYEDFGTLDLLRRGAATARRPWRLNELVLAEYDDLGPEEVLARVRRFVRPTGTTAQLGGRIGLTDGVVHHQDIRRGLGLSREVPAERLLVALDFAVWAPPLRGAWRARGIRLVATDLDWSRGSGPEAAGPAEAVLMAMAGRGPAANDLTGPGVDLLRSRAGGR
jgi:uncharacterized protein (TIGR03083 family)